MTNLRNLSAALLVTCLLVGTAESKEVQYEGRGIGLSEAEKCVQQ